VLLAQARSYAVFVADRLFRDECVLRGVPVAGVASILLHHRRRKHLSAADVAKLAQAIEAAGYYTFSHDERGALGLPP